MQAGEILFSLVDVNKWYGTKGSATINVLKDLNFEVRDGEVLGLVGPSGCGKSTILRLISGVDSPSSGKVDRIQGEIKSASFGYVFQDSSLMRWRTVRDNIKLPLEIERTSNPQRVNDLVRMMNLQGFENFYPSQLSGGMQRRVAIARALVHSPHVLLLDEPFTGIDEITKESLQTELNNIIVTLKVTGILVTHDINEAVYLCTRILVLSPRPAQIIQEVSVPLSRNRVPSMRIGADFVKTCEVIRRALKLL